MIHSEQMLAVLECGIFELVKQFRSIYFTLGIDVYISSIKTQYPTYQWCEFFLLSLEKQVMGFS